MIDRKYLPSKQFQARAILIAIAIGLILGIYGIVSFFKNRAERRAGSVQVRDIVIKDSNNNGIPDWEETLWGLDPSKNGASNKEFIEAKKAALGSDGASGTVSESDQMSREFFALVTALQQSGNLNDATMQEISNAIAEKVIANPIPDTYAKESQKIVATTPASIRTFYNAFKELSLRYADRDLGTELTFIYQGLRDNDQQALYVAGTVAASYRSFGKDLIAIPVPSSLQVNVLSLANNYEKSAETIEDMQNILTDQLKGMRAIVNYKKYNDGLITDLETMKTFFTRNGILK